MRCGLFNSFNYEGKSPSLETADKLLTAPRYAFGYKSIDCYKLNQKHAAFYESRPLKNHTSVILFKSIAAGAALLGSVIIIYALAVKLLNKKDSEVAQRYCERRDTDKFRFKPRLSNHLITRVVTHIFLRFTHLDQLTVSMQLQGDKVIRSFASAAEYEGGLSLPVANILIDKIHPYLHHDDVPFSESCHRTKNALETFKDISEKMTPIMMSRLLPLSCIFNCKRHTKLLAKDLADDLKHLKRSQVIMVPLTFYAPTKGYRTIISSFIKSGKNQYEWKIYRPDIGDEGKITKCRLSGNKVPAIRLKGITRRQVTDNNFLKKLIQHATFKQRDQGQHFFQFLKQFENDHENVIFSRSVLKSRPQHADIYTLHSLNFAMKDFMGKKFYDQLKMLMKADDLIALQKAIDSHSISNPEKLNDASQLLAYAADRLKRKSR